MCWDKPPCDCESPFFSLMEGWNILFRRRVNKLNGMSEIVANRFNCDCLFVSLKSWIYSITHSMWCSTRMLSGKLISGLSWSVLPKMSMSLAGCNIYNPKCSAVAFWDGGAWSPVSREIKISMTYFTGQNYHTYTISYHEGSFQAPAKTYLRWYLLWMLIVVSGRFFLRLPHALCM